MSRKDMQSDEIEEIMKEMLNDDEYADEGFEDIDREDNRHESKKAMKKEKKAGFRPENFSHYLRIQLELWGNIIRRVKEFR